jgi:hypothetical protein
MPSYNQARLGWGWARLGCRNHLAAAAAGNLPGFTTGNNVNVCTAGIISFYRYLLNLILISCRGYTESFISSYVYIGVVKH